MAEILVQCRKNDEWELENCSTASSSELSVGSAGASNGLYFSNVNVSTGCKHISESDVCWFCGTTDLSQCRLRCSRSYLLLLVVCVPAIQYARFGFAMQGRTEPSFVRILDIDWFASLPV